MYRSAVHFKYVDLFILGFKANNKFISQLLLKRSGESPIFNPNPFTHFRRFYSENHYFTPLSGKSELNPLWVTGFIDGEGSFILNIYKDKRQKIGWRVLLSFKIVSHIKDRALLEIIRNFLGVGQIYSHESNTVELRIQSMENLAKIIEHLDKYPLITAKLADYKLFKQAYDLMLNSEHLKGEGLLKFVGIKASINWGLSPELVEAFPGTTPVKRPDIITDVFSDFNWLAGFTSAEGCFFVDIKKSPDTKLGKTVQLKFILVQHARDEKLMISMLEYLDCGKIHKSREAISFVVTKIRDLAHKIIPLFKNYPILGVKARDFEDFVTVVNMIKAKKHLTAEGLEEIMQIKIGMNKGRK